MKNKIIQKITTEAKKTAESMLLKVGVTTFFTQNNVKLVCKMYNNTLNIAPNYLPQTRSKFVSALQQDIQTLFKQGKTKDEIMTFYWTISEFNTFWKRLNLTQKDLENIIFFVFGDQKEKE
jgi:hypothetical protein